MCYLLAFLLSKRLLSANCLPPCRLSRKWRALLSPLEIIILCVCQLRATCTIDCGARYLALH